MKTNAEPQEVVIFRAYKDNGDIVAIFPYILGTNQLHCQVYEHVGQHGAGDYLTMIKITTPIKPKHEPEVDKLRKELKSVGYTNLKEIKKVCSLHTMYQRLNDQKYGTG